MLRKKKTDNNKFNKKYILGIVLVLLSLIAAAAVLGILAASWSVYLNKVQQYLFGVGVILFPVSLLVLGLKLLAADFDLLNTKKLLLFFLFVLCLLGTAHNIYVPNGEELFPDKLLSGGGFIGGIISLVLHRTIGETGSWLVLSVGWLTVLYNIIPFKTLYKLIFGTDNKTNKNETEYSNLDRYKKTDNVRPIKKMDLPRANKKNTDIYSSKEFASFTAGIHKETAFKKILSFGSQHTYKEKEVQEIKRDPVQIPEWEENKKTVIVRPVINYENNKKILNIHPTKTESPQPTIVKEAPEISVPKESAAIAPFTKSEHIQAVPPSQNKIVIVDYTDNKNLETEKTAVNNSAIATNLNYRFPPLEILDNPVIADPVSYESDIMQQCSILEQTLADFKVKASVIAVTRGPSVTRFELEPAPGVKVSSVVNLADDIALKLAASGVRIEAPIPGKAAIGIEVPNIKNDPVFFKEVVDNAAVTSNSSKLCIGLGKDISGNIITADLSKMPHLLVAGSTGSGKSVCINTIIAGILYKASPDDVKLILVDPKVVELSNYNGIPHLLTPVVTDAKKAASALHWAVAEMERRYQLFADNHVREINSYNQKAAEKMPFIVIIIDELSDLMMVAKVDVEDAILRLAQKARAAGIHLILATQRPSVDVITGIVKANIPSRIAFAVSSQTDSRTILDMGGAEKLLGKGDMLFYPIGFNKPVRVQGAFVSDSELNRIVDFITRQSIPLNYSEEITAQALECDAKNNSNNLDTAANSSSVCDDDLFEDAVQLVLDMGQASSSMLQRRFRIGYTRAARLVDIMEELGIVGQSAGSKPREVIMSRQEVEERFLKHE